MCFGHSISFLRQSLKGLIKPQLLPEKATFQRSMSDMGMFRQLRARFRLALH